LLRPLVFSRLMIVQAVILTIIGLTIWRLVIREIKHQLRRRGIGIENAIIVGAEELGMSVLRTIVSRPDLGYKAIGFLDDDPTLNSTDLGRVVALGAIRNLENVLQNYTVDMVIVTLPWERHGDIVNIVKLCEQYGVAVRIAPDLFQLNLAQMEIEFLGGIPIMGTQKRVRFNPANHLIKRAIDLILVTLAMPIVLPIIGLIALAIRLDTPGFPFFGQERVGMNGKRFKIIKFRSMVQNAEAMWDNVLKGTNEDLRRPKIIDDPRVTRVGRFLRRTSLDELPNIFNVLKGDMSLIGPRPQVVREVELYAPWQYQRLKVRPGMTGLWQVSGRSEVPFDEMCLMDIYYIENWSLTLDLQILLQTAPRVLLRIGAY
jgi:exopolysaccharide biosynthesis polyprenyl glycosylphosphotransferase